MSFIEFINESWVTLLLTFLPLYYAFQLLKNERIEMIRPKGSKAIEKKKRKFSKSGEIFGAGRIDCNANNVRKSVRLRPEFFGKNMLG